MKETFDAESKKALIEYRIERAYATLKRQITMRRVATIMLQSTDQTHQGARAMLGLHFVSKDILSKEDGKTFHDLFEKRHSGDYDDFVFCDQEMIDELYPRAMKLIDDIKELLK